MNIVFKVGKIKYHYHMKNDGTLFDFYHTFSKGYKLCLSALESIEERVETIEVSLDDRIFDINVSHHGVTLADEVISIPYIFHYYKTISGESLTSNRKQVIIIRRTGSNTSIDRITDQSSVNKIYPDNGFVRRMRVYALLGYTSQVYPHEDSQRRLYLTIVNPNLSPSIATSVMGAILQQISVLEYSEKTLALETMLSVLEQGMGFDKGLTKGLGVIIIQSSPFEKGKFHRELASRILEYVDKSVIEASADMIINELKSNLSILTNHVSDLKIKPSKILHPTFK